MTYVEVPTPGINENLKNFLGLQNEVLNFGFNDGPQVNRNRIKMWLNEALGQIAQVNAPEYQATEELELEQGVWQYALPANFDRMDDIYYPEVILRLKPLDIQDFDELGPNIYEGPPAFYALYGQELRIFPTPNASGEKLEIRYFKAVPWLVEDTDVPVLDARYWHLLIGYAVARAFEAEDDQEMAQAHLGRYKQDLAAYATNLQWRINDRPRVVDGSWQGGGYQSGGRWV